MLTKRLLWPLAVAGLVGCLFARPSAQGITPDQPVYFTFSAPVSLPGVTLPAGEYEFRLSSSQADRHIVQVYSKQAQKYVGMFFAMPSMRSAVPEKAEVTFFETPSGTPPAVQTWWYPGVKTGHEFIYPRQQAEKLATSSSKGVLTTKGEDTKSGSITRLTANGEAAVNAESSTRNETAKVDHSADTNLQARATTSEPRHALPKTASELPAIAVMGLASLFAGLMLTRRRAV